MKYFFKFLPFFFLFLFFPAQNQAISSTSIYATQVIAFDTHGNAGGGIFNPMNALGAPHGLGFENGSLHVHSLGAGGYLTLGFDVLITDGPGADFIVSENPFISAHPFSVADMAFVEVSSDGVNFARFPARYYGPQMQPPIFAGVQIGYFDFLTGAIPVLMGSPAFPGADPQDVVEAGGDPFDLGDLEDNPLVMKGLVNLNAISQIRLVDVVSGVSTDQTGAFIWEPGFNADIDAVTVIHHTGNQTPHSPQVQIRPVPDGTLVVKISDPDGVEDLDLTTLKSAIYGVPSSNPLQDLEIISQDETSYTLLLAPELRDEEFMFLAVSVEDFAGNQSGYGRARPPAIMVDCNDNLVADEQDIANGSSLDCNLNGQPDECEGKRFRKNHPRNKFSKNATFRFRLNTDPLSFLQSIEVLPRRKLNPKRLSTQRFSANATVTVIAKELTNGPDGDDYQVQLDYSTDKGIFQPVFQGQNIMVGMMDSIDLSLGSLVFKGKSAFPEFANPEVDYETLSDSPFAVVLQDGNSFQSIVGLRGFGGQLDAGCFIGPYIDPLTQRIDLPPEDLLVLFELGTDQGNSQAFDLQDLIIRVSPNP